MENRCKSVVSILIAFAMLFSCATILSFAVADNDATLSAITIDGNALRTLRSGKTTYDVEVPYTAGRALPVVAATATNPSALVVPTQAADFDNPATILVTAADGVTQLTYTLNFIYAGKDAADLDTNLVTNGGFEDGFTGWNNLSGKAEIYSGNSAYVYEGSKSAVHKGTSYNSFYPADISLASGKTYIYSFQAKFGGELRRQIYTGLAANDESVNMPYKTAGIEKSAQLVTPDNWSEFFMTVYTTVSTDNTMLYHTTWDSLTDLYVDDFYLGELLIGDIRYGGATTVAALESGENATITLSGTPYNQLGTTRGLYSDAQAAPYDGNYTMSYSLAEDCTGVSISGNTLSVDHTAELPVVEVIMTCTPSYPGARQVSASRRVLIHVAPPQAPTASDVHIDGDVYLGGTLTGDYTYADVNEDEEADSAYQWFICDTVGGVYTPIARATQKMLVIRESMFVKYLKFQVTPKNAAEYGDTASPVMSPTPIHINYDPTLSGDASLSGITVNGAPIRTFKADKIDYTIELPYTEGMSLPVVAATANDAGATIESITQVTDFSTPAVIRVVAENSLLRTYTVHFSYAGKDAADLENNLVTNGGFEDGLTGWFYASGKAEVYSGDRAYIYEGSKSGMITGAIYNQFYPSGINLVGGKTYIATYYGKCETGTKTVYSVFDGVDEDWHTPFRTAGIESTTNIFSSKEWFEFFLTIYPNVSSNNVPFVFTNWGELSGVYVDNVYIGELLIGDIRYNGATTVTIPTSEGDISTLTLSGAPYNQLGTSKGLYTDTQAGAGNGNYTMSWALAEDYPGISIDGNVISVTNRAYAQTIEVIVTCNPLYPGAAQDSVSRRILIDVTGGVGSGTAPIVYYLRIDGVFEANEVLTADYTYYQINNKAEGATTFQWYYSDSENGNYTEIPGATSDTYTVLESQADGFSKVKVKPVTESGIAGGAFMSYFICSPRIPEARAISISGKRAIGETLTGNYTYFDINGDEEFGTTVKWMIANTADDVYCDIDGAMMNTLTVTAAMVEKYIKFCVTPRNASEENTTLTSSTAYLAATTPEANRVRIVKVSNYGTLYRAEYEYFHANGISEGRSEYAWYINGNIVSNTSVFNAVDRQDIRLTLRVTPVASIAPTAGAYSEASIQLSGYSGGGGSGGFSINVPTPPAIPYKPTTRHWAQDAIDFVVEKGIMSYPEEDDFQMDSNITRADFVYYIAKAAGLTEAEYSLGFGDVSASDYYVGMLQSAVDARIISIDENFYPNRNVSREEICKIVTTAAKVELGDSGASLDKYADKTNMADWALPYIKGAVESGLLIGVSDTEFMPKGNVTRAQTAVIIKRMMDSLE